MPDNNVALDFFGREIRIGDIVVYPVRRGSQMWLNRLIVQKLTFDPAGNPRLSGVKGDGYPVSVTSMERVAIIGRNGEVPL